MWIDIKRKPDIWKKRWNSYTKGNCNFIAGFFQAGNANKSDRYFAEDMYAELNDMAGKKEISAESIPKVKTIRSWITWYAAACKAEMARIVLNHK